MDLPCNVDVIMVHQYKNYHHYTCLVQGILDELLDVRDGESHDCDGRDVKDHQVEVVEALVDA